MSWRYFSLNTYNVWGFSTFFLDRSISSNKRFLLIFLDIEISILRLEILGFRSNARCTHEFDKSSMRSWNSKNASGKRLVSFSSRRFVDIFQARSRVASAVQSRSFEFETVRCYQPFFQSNDVRPASCVCFQSNLIFLRSTITSSNFLASKYRRREANRGRIWRRKFSRSSPRLEKLTSTIVWARPYVYACVCVCASEWEHRNAKMEVCHPVTNLEKCDMSEYDRSKIIEIKGKLVIELINDIGADQILRKQLF